MHLPTTDFQGQAVTFREGMSVCFVLPICKESTFRADFFLAGSKKRKLFGHPNTVCHTVDGSKNPAITTLRLVVYPFIPFLRWFSGYIPGG